MGAKMFIGNQVRHRIDVGVRREIDRDMRQAVFVQAKRGQVGYGTNAMRRDEQVLTAGIASRFGGINVQLQRQPLACGKLGIHAELMCVDHAVLGLGDKLGHKIRNLVTGHENTLGIQVGGRPRVLDVLPAVCRAPIVYQDAVYAVEGASRRV